MDVVAAKLAKRLADPDRRLGLVVPSEGRHIAPPVDPHANLREFVAALFDPANYGSN